MPLRVRVPAPVLVMPPLSVPLKSVILELIVVIAPELRTPIVPEVKSFNVSGWVAPFAKVTFPVVALLARFHTVALAETEVLPFPAPSVRVLAVAPDPFVKDVVFVELNPSLNVIEVAKISTPEIVIPVAATFELLPAPAKMKL